jgi:prepilin signal peptidase PulO-like enzyme (type II secretory pathway)
MAIEIAREAAIILALIAGAITDIRRREVNRLSLLLIALAGALTFNIYFLIQSVVLLAAFCVWIVVKKTDIGFGGGDIWVIIALAFAAGPERVLLSLSIGFLIHIIVNKIKYGKANIKKEAPLVPFIAAGHIVTLSILLLASLLWR